MKNTGNVTAADFHHELYRRFDAETDSNGSRGSSNSSISLTAGELHKALHAANRIQAASNALYDVQNIGDTIQNIPSGGVGATLEITYLLPREIGLCLEKSRYTPKEIAAAKDTDIKIFEAAVKAHPVFGGLAQILRQKKSEKAALKLRSIGEDTAALLCKTQHIRVDNKKFGTLCGAVERSCVLSDEAVYALNFVRICTNSAAHRIPDEYLLTPKVYAFEAHAAAVFIGEVLEKRLIWRGEIEGKTDDGISGKNRDKE